MADPEEIIVKTKGGELVSYRAGDIYVDPESGHTAYFEDDDGEKIPYRIFSDGGIRARKTAEECY